jgi:YVTN family beta-propeller protein
MALPSRDGCKVFVSIVGRDATPGIAVLRRAAGTLSLDRVIPIDGAPTGLALTHDGTTLAVTNGSGVAFVDVLQMEVVGSIEIGPEAGTIQAAITRDDTFLFVPNERNASISVIDLRKGFRREAVVGKIPVAIAPVGLVFSPDEKFLYATSQRALPEFGWPAECKPEGNSGRTDLVNPAGAIFAIDVAKAKTNPSGAVVMKAPAGCSPVRLALSKDGARAFVTARNSNAMLVFDTRKLSRIGQVAVGTAPVGIAVLPQSHRVVVTNSDRFGGNERQTLTIIDSAKLAVTGSIEAKGFPREIRLSSDGRTMFVTNFASKSVEMVELKTALKRRPAS